MGLARAGLLRDVLGSLAVVGVVVVIAFGLPFLDHSLPDTRPITAGVPYRVGGSVTVVPPTAANLDVTKTRPGRDQGTALFILDGVRVAVVVTPYRHDLGGAAERLRTKIVRVGDTHLTDEEGPTSTAASVAGRQGGYASPGRTGRYAVFVADGHSTEVTASGSESDLARLRPALDTMVGSVSFGGGP